MKHETHNTLINVWLSSVPSMKMWRDAGELISMTWRTFFLSSPWDFFTCSPTLPTLLLSWFTGQMDLCVKDPIFPQLTLQVVCGSPYPPHNRLCVRHSSTNQSNRLLCQSLDQHLHGLQNHCHIYVETIQMCWNEIDQSVFITSCGQTTEHMWERGCQPPRPCEVSTHSEIQSCGDTGYCNLGPFFSTRNLVRYLDR